MRAKNLAIVTTDLIESYGNTAKNVINAYQLGGERVAVALEQRWDSALQASRAQLSAEVAKNASAAQKAFGGYYTKGLQLTSGSAHGVVDQLVKLAETGVQSVAANASLFEEKTGLAKYKALDTLAQATVPAVLVVADLAAKIEAQSALLAAKAAGTTAKAASVKRTSAFRKARTAKAA